MTSLSRMMGEMGPAHAFYVSSVNKDRERKREMDREKWKSGVATLGREVIRLHLSAKLWYDQPVEIREE